MTLKRQRLKKATPKSSFIKRMGRQKLEEVSNSFEKKLRRTQLFLNPKIAKPFLIVSQSTIEYF